MEELGRKVFLQPADVLAASSVYPRRKTRGMS